MLGTMGPLVQFALAVVGTLACAALAWRARRWRRRGDHPHCRRCDFDLFGLPAGAGRCSECGADLTAQRAVAIGARRPAWGILSVAVTLGTACLIAAAWAGDRVEWRVIRVRVVPTAWLIDDLRRAPPVATAAAIELRRRVLARDVAGGALVDVVRALWTIRGSARSTVRAGDALPLQFTFGPSLFLPLGPDENLRDDGTSAPSVLWTMRDCAIGNAGQSVDPRGGISDGSFLPAGVAVSRGFSPTVPATMPAGAARVRCRFEFRLIDRTAEPTQATPIDLRSVVTGESPALDSTPYIAAWDVVVDLRTTVLAAGVTSDVTQVVDPALRASMQASIRPIDFGYVGFNDPQLLGRIALRVRREGGSLGGLEITRPPIGIAADVALRDPATGREFALGSFAAAAGQQVVHQLDPSSREDWKAIGESTSPTVDLILRPNVDVARRGLYVSSMWGEDIVLSDVKVRRDAR